MRKGITTRLLALCFIAALVFGICACAESDTQNEHLYQLGFFFPTYGQEKDLYEIGTLSGLLVGHITGDTFADDIPADVRSAIRDCFTQRNSFMGYTLRDDGSIMYLITGYSEQYLIRVYLFPDVGVVGTTIDDFSEMYAYIKQVENMVDDGHDLVEETLKLQFEEGTDDMKVVSGYIMEMGFKNYDSIVSEK